LILSLYRDEDLKTAGGQKSSLRRLLRKMLIEDLSISLELNRLKEFQVKSLLDGYFPKASFPAEFADRLFKETEGNPLYVREVLKSLVANQYIINADGSWKLAKRTADLPLPRTIEEVIRSRLEVLKPEELSELEKATVIGDTFTYKLFQELSQLDEAPSMEYLERFLDYNLIIEVGAN
jgi:predicted ATPase